VIGALVGAGYVASRKLAAGDQGETTEKKE
jgi:hypothetical protein